MQETSILIIDDDETFTRILVRSLSKRGLDATSSNTTDESLQLIQQQLFTNYILDLNLAGQSGLLLIEPIIRQNPDAKIIILTGYASIATAVEAVKLGAFQYLVKPTDVETLIQTLGINQSEAESDSTDYEIIEIADSRMSVDRLEWEHIQHVLMENNGNISATARALNMHRRTLQRKLLKKPVKS